VQTTEVRKEMIEIHIRLKIDTNDPREAYLQAMGALAFSGHEHVVSDYWLINGKPLPKQVAQNVKLCNGRRDTDRIDPHVQAALENLHDLAVAFTDEDNPEAIGIMEELDVLVDNAIPMNPVPEVTQCVTPETLKGLPTIAFTEDPYGKEPPSLDAMRSFSALLLENILEPMFDGFMAEHHKAMGVEPLDVRGYDLPKRECIHEQVDFDLTPNETPMFRAMQGEVDFDVGTAEGNPISEVDVEIADLLGELGQAE